MRRGILDKPEVINFDKVSFFYGKNEILRDVTFSVKKEDFFAIIGPNGGGKTTILRLMLGFIKPTSGKITVFGEEPGKNFTKIASVPQFSSHDRLFPITVEEVVLQGLVQSTSFLPFYSKAEKAKAEDAMKKLGILERADARFGDLSGGLKQRTLIARAIVSDPEILLLDEPVASVDSSVEKDIYEMLLDMNKKITIVMVSHDIGFVSSFVTKIGCVNKIFVEHHSKDEMCCLEEHHAYSGKTTMVHHKCGI